MTVIQSKHQAGAQTANVARTFHVELDNAWLLEQWTIMLLQDSRWNLTVCSKDACSTL